MARRLQAPVAWGRSHADLVRTAAAPNPWPTESQLGAAGAEQFRAVFGGYHAACMQVGEDVLSSLALALGASPGELLGLHRSRDHTVELKCLPVLPAPAPSSSVAEYQSALMAVENDAPDSPSPALERSGGRLVLRVEAHTDFCSLTLLALPPDDVGGLQERSAKGALRVATCVGTSCSSGTRRF